MTSQSKTARRPKIIISATDADRLTRLATQMEQGSPVISDLLFDEIERAQVKPDHKAPDTVVGMNSTVEFIDEARGVRRTVQLVYPAEADISAGLISVATPIGVGLLGLSPGQTIAWPDRDGHERTLRVLSVSRQQPAVSQ